MPSPVDDYFKKVKKDNPSYSDSQAWATAWSIYCKHKNPGSEHCKKETSEYFKGKNAMDDIALRVAAQSSVPSEMANRVASRHMHALQMGTGTETDKWRIHRFFDSISIVHLENAGKRGKKCKYFNLSYGNIKGDALLDSIAFDVVDLAKKNVSLSQMEAGLKDIVDDFENAGNWVRGIDLRDGEKRGIDVMPAGVKPVKISGKYVEIEATMQTFSIRDKVDKNNLPVCIPAIKGGKKSIPTFYRWVQDNQTKLEGMKFQEILKAMDANDIEYHDFCAMD